MGSGSNGLGGIVDSEILRLEALRDFRVLDTLSDESLDGLTRLAAGICDTPTALISLVDEQRQWFLSRFGFEPSETPRDISFCSHAIEQDELLVVEDASADERFAENPLVTDFPHIRFYAGAPLVTNEGHRLGTLCVMDQQARGLTPFQRQSLVVLSRQVLTQLELRRKTRQHQEISQRLSVVTENLLEQNAQLQTVLKAAHMGIWFWDCRTHQMQTIQGCGPLSGLPPELYPDSSEALQKLIHPDDWKPLVDRLGRAMEQEVFVCKFRMLLEPRQVRWVSIRGQVRRDPQGELVGISGVDQDVTERQSYLVRVEHLNRVYAVLSDINQSIAREKDAQRLLESACRVAVSKGQFRSAWIGLFQEEKDLAVVAVEGEGPFSEPHPLRETALSHLRSGQIFVENDLPSELGYRSLAVLPLHTVLEVKGCLALSSAEPDFFDTDELRLLAELASDITQGLERLRVQEALLESEARFRQLAENIDVVFWMVDKSKDELLYVSPAYERIWGRSAQSLYGSPRSWLDSVHPEDLERVRSASDSRRSPREYDEVFRIVRSDGSVRWIHDQGFPVYDGAGTMKRVVGTAEDITARHQLEEQLRQSQKMEAVGQLAGGVAHDFNNLLAVILMQAELARASPEDAPEMLEEIVTAAERAAGLTRQLLAFSRRQVIQRRQLDINQVVSNLTHMLRRLLGEQITLVLELPDQPLWTWADSGMLEQILVNLAVNSRDATPGDGLLEISTRASQLRAGTPDAEAGDYVSLQVRDNGSGMSQDIMDHMFEPFFSTKEDAKGTGLGLSTVFGLVKQHGGFISVDSEVGRGTTFEIYLPALPADQVVAQEDPPLPAASSGGDESILLVEDDEGVRRLTAQVLRSAGYRVRDAANGPAALEVWERMGQEFQLLITDIVMPGGLTGLELAARLQGARGDLKVLLISGYSSEFCEREQPVGPGRSFLAKPAQAEKLLEAVRRLLDQA